MIAAIYARKSNKPKSNDTEHGAASVPLQIERARQYAVTKGWTIDERSIFSDTAISGAEFQKRPGLTALLESLHPKPRFDVLILSETSRLGREQIETAWVLKQIIDADVKVYTFLDDTEVTLGSAIEKFTTSVKHFASESEREQGSTRVRNKMKELAEKGLPTGNRLYGYENVKGTRTIKASEAKVVQQIYTLRAQGLGHYRIARALERDGHTSPRGGASWSMTQVRAILSNEAYHGVVTWGRTKKTKKKGTTVVVKTPESIIRIAVPARRIVPEDVWEKVQEIGQAARDACWRAPDGTLKSRPTVGKGKHLLTPILACGVCQGPMHFRRDTRGREFLICANVHRYGKKKCSNGTHLPVAWAEKAIIAKFEEALCGDIVLKKIQEVLDAHREHQEDPEPLQAEARSLKAQITRLVDQAALGDLVEIHDGITTRKTKLAAIEARLAGLGMKSIDMEAFRQEVTAALSDLTQHLRKHPSTAAQVLRKICPTRIAITPLPGGGWKLDGEVNYKEVLKTSGFEAAKLAVMQLAQLPQSGCRPSG